MGRKKKWYKRLFTQIFGKTFGLWDVLILVILIGYGTYIYMTKGLLGFTDLVLGTIFYALVISVVVKWMLKKTKR
jgi:hypothetical protein